MKALRVVLHVIIGLFWVPVAIYGLMSLLGMLWGIFPVNPLNWDESRRMLSLPIFMICGAAHALVETAL